MVMKNYQCASSSVSTTSSACWGPRSSEETRLGWVICGPQPLPLAPSTRSLDAAKQTVATLAKTGGPSHVTTTLSNAKRISSPPVETPITTRNYMLQNEEAFEALSLASPDDTLAGCYLNYRLNTETLFAESDHWYNVGELYHLLFTMRRTNLDTQMERDAMFDALSSNMEVNTPFGELLNHQRKKGCKGRHQAVRDMPEIDRPDTLTPTGPFWYVGVDFTGLILSRNQGTHHEFMKTSVCVFTCMVVRVIHLELVIEMTVNGFLSAFCQYISRRYQPKLIQSDNFWTFH
ncbi:hypothetical protein T10_5527 [Trichinella papuae]|uniref:Integrase catalytic domain-containing protein n=1 Tax=Trichinella papuae TaxID=268474 RepID=A0A0V1N819_9BILA|nr:hypothetical protein T10_5527 [Trichinella papuae]